ncbi:hypothetical protein IJT93_08570 [bacterium]|nr:hypothetical protein [bacterium]
MFEKALRTSLLCCALLFYAAARTEAALPDSGYPSPTAQASGAAAKKPPKDGNEGTYPTFKSAKKQSGSSAAKGLKPLLPPKDGNEGTYPTYKKGSGKQEKASDRSGGKKACSPPKDGNEGTYPTHKSVKQAEASGKAAENKSLRSSAEGGGGVSPVGGDVNREAGGPDNAAAAESEAAEVRSDPGGESGEPAAAVESEAGINFGGNETEAPAVTAPEEGAAVSSGSSAAEKAQGASENSPAPKKVGSVPFVHKNVSVLTAEEAFSLGLPVTKDEVLQLYKRHDFTLKTPDYTLNGSRLNVEIGKRGKLRVSCDLRQIKAKALLLAAFHMPMLPGEEQAERIWLIKSDSPYSVVDMGELEVGVYQFLAVALDGEYKPAARPNLQRMMLSYGYKEALIDYKDRQFLLYGDISKPAAFGEIEIADAAKELPLFKVVPATCVLKPGEKIELTAERLLSHEQRRLNRINKRYGGQDERSSAKTEEQAKSSGKSGKTKPKRFCWSMYGQGRLVPVGDNKAVYYAPNFDAAGAEISCWEEGDEAVVNAHIYVTTLPIGEIPSLEKTTFSR